MVGNSHKPLIADIRYCSGGCRGPYHGQITVGDIFAQREFLSAPVEDAAGDRTRPNLKIQDGCNNRCSFCIIPFVRGRSRSMPADEVVARVRALAERYREVVLSGINLGRWGREPGSAMRLVDLLRRILAETGDRAPAHQLRRAHGLQRCPSGSHGRIATHREARPRAAAIGLGRGTPPHAPEVQTASLRRPDSRARALMPDCAVGADVMVGFPGETDEEFEQNRQFIASLPFTYLHVFTYSERPGTPAAERPDQVPLTVRKQRNTVLRELAAEKNLAFRQTMIGRTLSAITLEQGALTGNYLKVDLAYPRGPGELVDIEIGSVSAAGLREKAALNVLN